MTLLPLAAAAARLGYKSSRSLAKRARRGACPFRVFQEGGRLVVRADELEAYMRGGMHCIDGEREPDLLAGDPEGQAIVEHAIARLFIGTRGSKPLCGSAQGRVGRGIGSRP